jgi:hypothetical protein
MFDGVDLEDSCVLGWHSDDVRKQLVFDLEVSVWPGHPHYSAPKSGEYTCYKRGRLIFEDVMEIQGLLPTHKVKSTRDPDGSIDYGYIEGFHSGGDGVYEFSGDVGDVRVTGGTVRLDIDEPRDTAE